MSSSPTPPGPYRAPYMVVYGPKANCTLELCPVEYSVYGYRPSLAANVAFIALYSVAIAIHTFLGVRWRQWWFMCCMLAGAVNAVLGYVGRLLMYQNPFNFVAFMIQISKSSFLPRAGEGLELIRSPVCVTTGPVYYCAAIYITFAMS